MKMPISLSEGGIKGLFIHHVEKMVLAIVMVMVALCVFSGYQRDTPDRGNSPTAIVDEAKGLLGKLKETPFSVVLEERLPQPDDYLDRAKKEKMPIVRAAAIQVPSHSISRPSPFGRTSPGSRQYYQSAQTE